MDNNDKIILDLCGGTGSWSKPYKEAGYDVRNDVKTSKVGCNVIHGLKILPKHFEEVRNSTKSFDCRKCDRDYRVGDYLALNEWDGQYTGRTELVKVTYILYPGAKKLYEEATVVMAIKKCGEYDTAKR